MALTKATLAEKIHRETGLTHKESMEMLEEVLDIIKGALQSGNELKIPRFGVFEVKAKRARKGRNPQTGESMILDARRVVTFKPSSLIRDMINDENRDLG